MEVSSLHLPLSGMRSSLKYIVEQAGHKVVGMGADGREEGDKVEPVLVTMETLMEEMDGIQALEAIMKDDPKAKVLIQIVYFRALYRTLFLAFLHRIASSGDLNIGHRVNFS